MANEMIVDKIKQHTHLSLWNEIYGSFLLLVVLFLFYDGVFVHYSHHIIQTPASRL